jgi:hypothetical protein
MSKKITKEAQSNSCCTSGIKSFLLPVIVAVAVFFLSQDCFTQFLPHAYPFVLLLTKYRQENSQAWEKYAPINKAIVYPLRPIPEINASGMVYLCGLYLVMICGDQITLWRTCARQPTTTDAPLLLGMNEMAYHPCRGVKFVICSPIQQRAVQGLHSR